MTEPLAPVLVARVAAELSLAPQQVRSTLALFAAWRAQARRLVLYHHDPAHDDVQVEAIERLAREKFPRAIAACEGLEILI